MRHFFLLKIVWALVVAVFFIAAPSMSQQATAQEIVSDPICFTVVNKAPYKIYGDFSTEKFTMPDGSRRKHRSNFRLEEAGAVHEKGYPLDMSEFCSYGPFFEGRKLRMTLRTLVPTFECKTNIESGAIIIYGERKPEGGTKTWAECFE